MSLALPVPPPGFDRLTVEEQIEYVEALSHHISASVDKVEIPDWHRRIIETRLKESRDDLGEETWEEFEKEFDSE